MREGQKVRCDEVGDSRPRHGDHRQAAPELEVAEMQFDAGDSGDPLVEVDLVRCRLRTKGPVAARRWRISRRNDRLGLV